MNPSGRGKLSVPYRSPDGEHCSRGCKWLLGAVATGPECRLFGPLVVWPDPLGRWAPTCRRSRWCRKYDSTVGRPTIVCLCGSTRFAAEMVRIYQEETLLGRIVLHPSGVRVEDGGKRMMLDRLHLAKIDLADEILVVNVGGYVGESTAREIEHARKHGKTIRWLEDGVF